MEIKKIFIPAKTVWKYWIRYGTEVSVFKIFPKF